MIRLILLLIVSLATFGSISQPVPQDCVQVFYDRSPDSSYWMGRTYATFLQNLLAHFPKYQQIVGPIEEYQKGDLHRCKASFYVGSHFDSQIPQDFFTDYATTDKSVVWMGYSIWKPGADYFSKIFGYSYSSLSKLNTDIRDEKGRPTFFKFATYKGEQFKKYGDWNRTDPSTFMAPFEAVLLRPSEQLGTEVISELIHNGTKERTPYVLRRQNKFYVADVPFSFMHESDRFLIVADLLFDILQETPIHDEKIAFLRIEDVFPLISKPFTYDVLKVLKEFGVKANVSLVPIFSDPLNLYESQTHFMAMENSPEFLQLLHEMRADGHSFLWHGVTHQFEAVRNPWDGISTDDFEFWDAIGNKPIAKDSPEWVLNRLEDGFYSIRAGGIDVKGWLTPHYQASPLDYLIFARVFSWNVGRMIYQNFEARGVPPESEDLHFGSSSENRKTRMDAFKNLKVETQGPWSGQIFPFLIFGDVYGQRIVPENLGNSQPFLSRYVLIPRSINEILEDARRNLVLRDTWASLFYHSALLGTVADGGRGQFPGDPADLRKLIEGIKNMGYRFVTMDEVNKRWLWPKRAATLNLKESRRE